MRSNKGQVEVQFNWIFILIAGAIILTFFVVIATRQKSAAEQTTNINFFVNFERSLAAISAEEENKLLFEIPNMDLRYDCTATCDCAAYAGTRAKPTAGTLFRMEDKIIFSPNRLKGNSLLTWSKGWAYPFRIVNFILMTSPEVKYLVEDGVSGRKINATLPPTFIEKDQVIQRAFDKQMFTPGQEIKGITGNYKLRFVFTNTNPGVFSIPDAIKTLPNSDVTAVKIEAIGDEGNVTFYIKDDSTSRVTFKPIGSSAILGEASIYAAIYAEDLNSYGCMMNRALVSLNMVAKMYKAKADLYLDESDKDPRMANCKIHYADLALVSLISRSSNFDFKDPGENSREFIQSKRDIDLQNNNALKGGCPQLY